MAHIGQIPSAGVVTAQVVGLTTASFTAGLVGAFTFITIPGIKLAPPQLAARQWLRVFNIGKLNMPPLAIGSAAIFASLAYNEPTGSASKPFYVAAALIVPSIVPYTVAFMSSTNAKLEASALATKAADIASESTTLALLDKWALLNAGRSAILLIGTACAAYAIFQKARPVK